MRKMRLFFTMLAVLVSTAAFAQNQKITGTMFRLFFCVIVYLGISETNDFLTINLRNDTIKQI